MNSAKHIIDVELLLQLDQKELNIFKHQIGTYGFCAVKLPTSVEDGCSTANSCFGGSNFFKSCQAWKDTYSFNGTSLGYTNTINNEYFMFNTGNMLHYEKFIPKEFVSKITFYDVNIINYKAIDTMMKQITEIIWKHFMHKTDTRRLYTLSLFKSAANSQIVVKHYCKIHSKHSVTAIPKDIIQIIALFYINNNECYEKDFGMVYCGQKNVNNNNIFCSLSLGKSELKFHDKVRGWVEDNDNHFHILVGPLAHKLSNGMIPNIQYECAKYCTIYNVVGYNNCSIFDSKFVSLNDSFLLKQKNWIQQYINEHESMELNVKRINCFTLIKTIKVTKNILELKKLFHIDWSFERPEQCRWVYRNNSKSVIVCMFDYNVLADIFAQFNVRAEEEAVIHAILNA